MSEDRKLVLLRAAYDLLKRSDDSPIVEETLAIQIYYDKTWCDGNCLMEEIADELGIDLDDEKQAAPLTGPEEGR